MFFMDETTDYYVILYQSSDVFTGDSGRLLGI